MANRKPGDQVQLALGQAGSHSKGGQSLVEHVTHVVDTTNVVNAISRTTGVAGALGIDGVDTTLEERIEWLCRDLGFTLGKGDRARPNVSGLSRAAGLSRSTLPNTLARGGGLSQDALAKLAAFAKVDPGWLLTGNGEPRPHLLPVADSGVGAYARYPNREAAIRFLVSTGAGSDPEVREAADRATVAAASDEDLEGEEWLAMIKAALRRVRRSEGEPGTPFSSQEVDEARAGAKTRFERKKKR